VPPPRVRRSCPRSVGSTPALEARWHADDEISATTGIAATPVKIPQHKRKARGSDARALGKPAEEVRRSLSVAWVGVICSNNRGKRR